MQFTNTRIVLTGAAGGIGSEIARRLAAQGAKLGLVDHNGEALGALCNELAQHNGRAVAIVADLTSDTAPQKILDAMESTYGGTDVLINGAGIIEFTEFAKQDPATIERMFRINVLAPMMLSRAMLPSMKAQRFGRIVNIGSVFGSIAFAWFTSYSASKFALRGFSEALRRELDGTGVDVTLVAPRAVKTPLNSPAVYQMAKKIKMNMDDPEWVAQQIVQAIKKDKRDVYLGFPESLFVRVNALLPRMVDKAVRKQNRVARDFL
jgi:short-subunit dehydrogenase